ncbi:hypothetical protein J8M97_01360 [Gordonia polyisoprenivorans]|uniref:hypothetical protein n=1 Tax=Gordonia polyisoprenivorans TaxID=84595 RepID=UPI00036F8594|nr:hypothetical protein [Gordonia polyisoprenivorans]QUD83360.1 hypothetical protein J8M97_01360 [Gordonia polyisoprenivorans]
MSIAARIATAVAVSGIALGAAVVAPGDAQAASPRDCRIYNYWAGASVNCPAGVKVVLELDCVGAGRNSGETQGVRIFYHRTSAVTDRSGFAATDCGQGSYIGTGVNTRSWVRATGAYWERVS